MQFYSLSRPILLTARHKMAFLYLLQRRPKTWNEFVRIDSLTDCFSRLAFPVKQYMNSSTCCVMIWNV